MDTGDLITVDPEILGGVPVFKGTRVPIKTLFEYLENDYSLEEFLECFPSVTRDLARKWRRTLAQRRKGAKRYRVSKSFLCAFAPLREKNASHRGLQMPFEYDQTFRSTN